MADEPQARQDGQSGPQARPATPPPSGPAGDANPYLVTPPGAAGSQQPPQGWAVPGWPQGAPAPFPPPASAQQPYGYGQPYGWGQPSPYQAPAPYPYAAGRPRTEPQAILALVLAVLAWLVMPVLPAVAAYFAAASAKSSILRSYGARGGLGLVTAARWVATVHLLLIIPGTLLFGAALFPIGRLL